MSADTLQRILSSFTGKIAHLDCVPDPMGLLTDFTKALARDTAETVFLKVQADAAWTQKEAQALADQTLEKHLMGIVETLHAHGGTLKMAEDLCEIAATAYGARLAELTVAYQHGGVA